MTEIRLPKKVWRQFILSNALIPVAMYTDELYERLKTDWGGVITSWTGDDSTVTLCFESEQDATMFLLRWA